MRTYTYLFLVLIICVAIQPAAFSQHQPDSLSEQTRRLQVQLQAAGHDSTKLRLLKELVDLNMDAQPAPVGGWIREGVIQFIQYQSLLYLACKLYEVSYCFGATYFCTKNFKLYCMIKPFLILLGLIAPAIPMAQTQFWSDTFEDAGAPSAGTRTASINFSCGSPATSYFFRTNVAGINLISGVYTGMQGTKFWAGEDIDYGSTCTNASVSANQQVTWSSINISGKTSLSFKGLFAANSSFGNNWEGSSFGASQDYIAVEYRIDGGTWTKAVAFYASTAAQTQTLKLETTGDLIGDGADLTYTFTEYTANIIGTGSLMDLRLNVFANGSGTEEIAADNFRLFYGSVLPIKLGSFSGTNKNGINTLQWLTVTEINSRSFDIERSADGTHFETAGTVAAAGNNTTGKSYSFNDVKALPGINYYRLKQTDNNNHMEYSGVITVKNSGNYSLSVYPNPTGNQIIVNGLKEKNAVYRIINTLRQMEQKGNLLPNNNSIGIPSLPKGIYYILIEDQAIKFIKQ